MRPVEASTRHSVRLPARVARQVRALAKSMGLSSSKVIADLVEAGLVAKSREQERERLFELTEQLGKSTSQVEQKRIKDELARLTFGGSGKPTAPGTGARASFRQATGAAFVGEEGAITSAQLAGSKAFWNRSAVDLRSDEQLAQLMDRGSVEDWAVLRDLALEDAALRSRMREVVERVEIGFPGFWLALLASMGEPVDWDRPLPRDQSL